MKPRAKPHRGARRQGHIQNSGGIRVYTAKSFTLITLIDRFTSFGAYLQWLCALHTGYEVTNL
jgi:DNA-binding transcriptional MerR regulator